MWSSEREVTDRRQSGERQGRAANRSEESAKESVRATDQPRSARTSSVWLIRANRCLIPGLESSPGFEGQGARLPPLPDRRVRREGRGCYAPDHAEAGRGGLRWGELATVARWLKEGRSWKRLEKVKRT